MKMRHYLVFYAVLCILCVSQVVVILGRSGQSVNTSAQLSYLQKYKLQLQQEINHSVAMQAKQIAIGQLMNSDLVLDQYQPITQVLAVQDNETKAISLSTVKP